MLEKATPPPRAEWRLNRQAQEGDHLRAIANKRFEKAHPARKRVLIARDVLKWMREGKLVANSGTYLGVAPNFTDWSLDEVRGELRVNDSSVVNGNVCVTCALGGLFACSVERGLAGGDIRRVFEVSRFDAAAQGHKIRELLSPYFSLEQLILIEAAFECSEWVFRGTLKAEEPWLSLKATGQIAAALAFGNRARNRNNSEGEPVNFDRERMTAIMQNIIDHKGTFDPSDVSRMPEM